MLNRIYNLIYYLCVSKLNFLYSCFMVIDFGFSINVCIFLYGVFVGEFLFFNDVSVFFRIL